MLLINRRYNVMQGRFSKRRAVASAVYCSVQIFRWWSKRSLLLSANLSMMKRIHSQMCARALPLSNL